MANQHAPTHDQHGHADQHGHEHHHAGRRRPHKDWRTWAVVALMLAAIVIYVMTRDESIVPGGPIAQPVPAAGSPAAPPPAGP